MIKVLATNIVSPLGITSEENYQSIKGGRTGLCQYQNLWGIPGTITASLFSEEQNEAFAIQGLSRFESLVYTSVKDALSKADGDILTSRTVFILATTKGDIETLSKDKEYPDLPKTAIKIAERLGLHTKPIVVCNACISGAAAQLLALRLLEAKKYDNAIVCGADCQSKFIMSGFSSLKALSEDFCRPFDIERYGLNLGEASATIIYGKADEKTTEGWYLHNGAIRNDAVHISNPSKTAEGCVRAISKALEGNVTPSMVSVHGTATLYNDQMEAIALKRTSLLDIPVMALKGYYGHTMGAAGILETIISMLAAEEHKTLPSKGFEELGVSAKIRISNDAIKTEGKSFLKIIAGFGGGNAALYLSKESTKGNIIKTPHIEATHKVKITPRSIEVDDCPYTTKEAGLALLTEIYKEYIDDYPKYYKMDGLSKVAFIASEMLIKAEGKDANHSEDRSVILFNNSSSRASDIAFLSTIEEDNYYPSPSVFVYTLPNIATGEIAIRNNYHGETSFYILAEKDEEMMNKIVRTSLSDEEMKSCLCGWVGFTDEEDFEAELFLMNKI